MQQNLFLYWICRCSSPCFWDRTDQKGLCLWSEWASAEDHLQKSQCKSDAGKKLKVDLIMAGKHKTNFTLNLEKRSKNKLLKCLKKYIYLWLIENFVLLCRLQVKGSSDQYISVTIGLQMTNCSLQLSFRKNKI